MTDQEQAKSGASTVMEEWDVYQARQRSVGHYYPTESTTFFAGWWARDRQLKADLERVTAERDAMRNAIEFLHFVWEYKCCHGCGNLWPCPTIRAIRRIDATRKATADATEEGK